MPSAREILEGLSRISNQAWILAALWHVVGAAAVAAWVLGWRPSRRRVGLMLTAPLGSVAIVAWVFGNPFNGTIFAALAAGLAAIALRLPADPPGHSPAWARMGGLALAALGWAYPHFVDVGGPLRHVYASPLGLIPCPTLCFAIGLSLLLRGLESTAWVGLLAAAGVFYGLFGRLRLGVATDGILLLGALLLAALRGAGRATGRPTRARAAAGSSPTAPGSGARPGSGPSGLP